MKKTKIKGNKELQTLLGYSSTLIIRQILVYYINSAGSYLHCIRNVKA